MKGQALRTNTNAHIIGGGTALSVSAKQTKVSESKNRTNAHTRGALANRNHGERTVCMCKNHNGQKSCEKILMTKFVCKSSAKINAFKSIK
jgi:hypothetical protein